ncbi:hypothetical protein EE612_055138 [Oryza sativa]|nr:hypothetical protein EE612_055138 [Oryza sativa]
MSWETPRDGASPSRMTAGPVGRLSPPAIHLAGVHNVVAASAAEYRSCKVRNSADAAATAAGSAKLDLKKGVNYFICGVPGHCATGMKLRVVAN